MTERAAGDALARDAYRGRDLTTLVNLVGGRHPEAEALVWVPFDGPRRSWSGPHLADAVRSRATGLQRRGVGRGDRVGLLMTNDPEFVISWLGIALSGAAAVCLNTRLSVPELTWIAGHSGLAGLITSPALQQTASEIGNLPWVETPNALNGGSEKWQAPDVDAFAQASIQYTSGTTSRPKGVVWTQANCLWAAQVNAAHQGLRDDDRYLVTLPLFHTNALSYSLLGALFAGATVVLQPRFSASRFWQVSVDERCTWTSVVSFCLRALAAHAAPADHHYRGWSGSAVVPPKAVPGGIAVEGWFGMTETVSHPVCSVPGLPDEAGSMGRRAAEYEIQLRDVVGDVGDLWVRGVRGVSLFAEYLHDPEATAAAFDDQGWFRTKDRVRVGTSGSVHFHERDGDVLKVGGENIGALEIEQVIRRVVGVADVAVVGRPDDLLGEVPVAFVQTTEPVGDLHDRIHQVCVEHLADFKQPREIRLVDALPRVTLEKVSKAELRRRLQEEHP